MKVHICYNRFTKDIQILKYAFKNEEPGRPFFTTRKNHGKTIKKILRVKCATVTCKTTRTVMAHNDRYLLVWQGDHQWTVYLKDFKYNRNNLEKNQETCPLTVLNDCSNNYSELFQSFAPASMEIQWLRCCRLLSYLFFKWPKSKLYGRNTLSFSNYNLQKSNLYVYSRNTIKYGNKRLMSLGSQICNSLLDNIE